MSKQPHRLPVLRKPLDFAVARHLLSDPAEGPSAVARHLRARPAQVHSALARIARQADLASEASLLAFLRRFPRRVEERHFAMADFESWFARPPAPVSLSGEDAAAAEGLPVVPHRHLLYAAPEDLAMLEASLRAAGAEPVARGEATVTLRVRDPWLRDDPAPLVERGQRLLDYAESRHPLLAGRFLA